MYFAYFDILELGGSLFSHRQIFTQTSGESSILDLHEIRVRAILVAERKSNLLLGNEAQKCNQFLTWMDSQRTRQCSLAFSIQWHREWEQARVRAQVEALHLPVGRPCMRDE